MPTGMASRTKLTLLALNEVVLSRVITLLSLVSCVHACFFQRSRRGVEYPAFRRRLTRLLNVYAYRLVADKENTANVQLHGLQPAAARCVPPLQSNKHSNSLNMPLRIDYVMSCHRPMHLIPNQFLHFWLPSTFHIFTLTDPPPRSRPRRISCIFHRTLTHTSNVPTIDYPPSLRSKGILRKGTVTFSTPSKTVAAADSVRRSVSEHKPPACSVAPLLQKSAVLASALTAVLHGDTETQDATSDLYKFSSFSSAKQLQASWTAPRPLAGTQVLRPLALPCSSLSQT